MHGAIRAGRSKPPCRATQSPTGPHPKSDGSNGGFPNGKSRNILPNCKNYPQYLPSEMGPHGHSGTFFVLLRTVFARAPDFLVRRASPGCTTGAPALPTAPPQQQKGSDHAITPLSCLQCPAPESFSGRGISILLLVEEIYIYLLSVYCTIINEFCANKPHRLRRAGAIGRNWKTDNNINNIVNY